MKVAAFAIAAFLASCAHAPEAIDLGAGRYSISAHANIDCPAGARQEAVDAANEFCGQRGQAVIEGFDDRGREFVYGPMCTSSVIFTCNRQ